MPTNKKAASQSKRTAKEPHFVSVTEVEERYFPKSAKRRRESEPLNVGTHPRIEDVLARIEPSERGSWPDG